MTAHMYDTPDPSATETLRPPPEPLSETLRKLPELTADALTVRAIADAVADRSLGAILALFAMVNCIPGPPGTSFFLGLPVVIVAAQLLAGQRSVWLPRRIAGAAIPRDGFSNGLARILPWLTFLERFLKPRFWPFSRLAGERIVGMLSLLLGIIIVLPIPLGNGPTAFAVALLGLALSERDGLWLLAGLVMAVASALLAGSIVAGAAWAATAAMGAGG
jgi:hypothetical protein